MAVTTTYSSLSSVYNFIKNRSLEQDRPHQINRSPRQKICGCAVDQVDLRYGRGATGNYRRGPSPAAELDGQLALLNGLIRKNLHNQETASKIAPDSRQNAIGVGSPEKKQEVLVDNDYFGVEMTSTRIVTSAIDRAKNNPAAIDAIRDEVKNGFKEAMDAFGGWLPDISYRTLDTVMSKLNAWAALDSGPQSQI